MTSFIPDFKVPAPSVPYFEDGVKLKIPGRATSKSVEQLQLEISKILLQIGAFNTRFVSGEFPGAPKRYGFRIYFQYVSSPGRIDVAALPMRRELPHVKRDALEQALFLFRNKIEAEYYASIYEPGSLPLVGYLIGRDGQTVTESLVANGNLPALGAG